VWAKVTKTAALKDVLKCGPLYIEYTTTAELKKFEEENMVTDSTSSAPKAKKVLDNGILGN